jgi:WD40 repeat protein
MSSSTTFSDPSLGRLMNELASAPARDVQGARARLLRPGEQLGRFTLVRELGRGGFGVVFEAIDPELDRCVAVKVLLPDRLRNGPRAQGQSVRREAQAAARLNHPNIVTVFDLCHFEGLPYLVLELLQGETLAARLRRGPLPAREAVAIAIDIARGLSHAHRKGVLHRDLKPANVFLAREGAVRVLDFGMAWLLESEGLPPVGGTPGFMAPEQSRGVEQDERADVFAFGVLLYSMLAGRLPSRGIVPDDSPAPRLRPSLAPCGLDDLVASTLASTRDQRPRDATALLALLLEVRARLEGRASRRRRLKRGGAAALAAVVLVSMLAPHVDDAVARNAAAQRRLALVHASQRQRDPLEAARLLARVGSADEPPGAATAALKLLALALPVEVSAPGAALARAPDGAAAVYLSDGGRPVLRPRVGRAVPLQAGEFPIADAAFAPRGGLLALADFGGAAWIFDAEARRVAVLRGHKPWTAVRSVRFSADGRRAITAGEDGTARIFDAATGDRIAVLRSEGSLRGAELDSSGEHAVLLERACASVQSLDGAVAVPLCGRATPLAASFGAAGSWVATAHADGSAILWQRDGARQRIALGLPFGVLRSARFDEAGALHALGADDSVRVFRIAPGAERPATLQGHRGPIAQLRFTPRGDYLASAGTDGTARVWKIATGESIVLGEPGAPATAVDVSADGALAATAHEDGEVVVFALEGGTARMVERHTLAAPLTSVALAPCACRVVVGDREGKATLFTLGERRVSALRPKRSAPVRSLAFAYGGSAIAASYADGHSELLYEGAGPPRPLRAVAVLAGPAPRAIVATLDGARIVGVDHGAPPIDVGLEGAALAAAAFAPGAARAALGATDGTIRVVTLDWPRLVELLRRSSENVSLPD